LISALLPFCFFCLQNTCPVHSAFSPLLFCYHNATLQLCWLLHLQAFWLFFVFSPFLFSLFYTSFPFVSFSTHDFLEILVFSSARFVLEMLPTQFYSLPGTVLFSLFIIHIPLSFLLSLFFTRFHSFFYFSFVFYIALNFDSTFLSCHSKYLYHSLCSVS
jgi:hypothetical protein